MYKLGAMDKQVIRQIVGRSHVQDDNETVIRRVMRKLKGLTEEQKEAVEAFVIETHVKNQNFFYKEMRF